MKYNQKIRNLREDHDMTQQQIADILNVGQRTYAAYEYGDARIPVDSLVKLAAFYNVSMDYISCATDEKRPYPKK